MNLARQSSFSDQARSLSAMRDLQPVGCGSPAVTVDEIDFAIGFKCRKPTPASTGPKKLFSNGPCYVNVMTSPQRDLGSFKQADGTTVLKARTSQEVAMAPDATAFQYGMYLLPDGTVAVKSAVGPASFLAWVSVQNDSGDLVLRPEMVPVPQDQWAVVLSTSKFHWTKIIVRTQGSPHYGHLTLSPGSTANHFLVCDPSHDHRMVLRECIGACADLERYFTVTKI